MNIILPKKTTTQFRKKVRTALEKIESGYLKPRSSNRRNLETYKIGIYERIVVKNGNLYAFQQHSQYEKFINAAA
ncbi:hypothetical protein I8Y06_003312 [Photobacterium damselae]|nr:hypothetical protein [Photobacterium damselae]